MAGQGQGGANLDPGTKVILKELRDLRLEMRADRRQTNEDRRRAEEERQRADEAWRQTQEAWRQERLQIDEERRRESAQAEERRRLEQAQSDERFERAMREFREDSILRAAETREAFKDIRTVGLSIVKTLNLHTRILEGIEQKLTPGPWPPGHRDGA